MQPSVFTTSTLVSLLAATLFSQACTSDDEDNASATIEIAGSWDTNFNSIEYIDDDWGNAAIVEFDNDQNYAITQNAEDAAFSPGKFNKLIWTEPANDSFFYCTVDFNKDTATEAKNTTNVADDSEPETMGCGGMFAWTKMTLRP